MFVIQLQWYVNVYKRLIVAYIYELCATLKSEQVKNLRMLYVNLCRIEIDI